MTREATIFPSLFAAKMLSATSLTQKLGRTVPRPRRAPLDSEEPEGFDYRVDWNRSRVEKRSWPSWRLEIHKSIFKIHIAVLFYGAHFWIFFVFTIFVSTPHRNFICLFHKPLKTVHYCFYATVGFLNTRLNILTIRFQWQNIISRNQYFQPTFAVWYAVAEGRGRGAGDIFSVITPERENKKKGIT